MSFYRLLFGGLALALLSLARGQIRARYFRWRTAGPFMLAGLVFAVDIFFWHKSIEAVGPGLATILGNFQVFFMVLSGVVLFRERLQPRFLVAAALACLGLLLLVGEDFTRLSGEYRLGVFFGLVTALSYATYMLLLKWAGGQGPPEVEPPGVPTTPDRGASAAAEPEEPEVTGAVPPPFLAITIVSFSGAAVLALAVWGEGASFELSGPRSVSILLAYGVLSQAVGWVLISKGIPHIRAAVAGLAILLQPALSFLWDILIFDRGVTWLEASGLALALGSIYLAVRNAGERA